MMNGNSCDSSQSANRFISGKLLLKYPAAEQNTYVLNSALNKDEDRIAVMLSNSTVQVYGTDSDLISSHAHEKEVTYVKFSNQDPFLLFSSSLDGKVIVWDSRCSEPSQIFLDDSDDMVKPLTCFDYNSDELYICAGTEIIREDSFLLFWDRRMSELLGGYWNSHTDDLTQVHFHPTVNSAMASSGVDGLINIFDLNEKSEDDALNYTLNAGSGVAKFCWKDPEHLLCTTSLEEYQLWSVNEASPTLCMSRNDLSKNYEVETDYLIGNIQIKNSWVLATGTYNGLVHLWNFENDGLKPTYCLSSGHSDIIRTVSYNHKGNFLVTGGEDGVICHWKLPEL